MDLEYIYEANPPGRVRVRKSRLSPASATIIPVSPYIIVPAEDL